MIKTVLFYSAKLFVLLLFAVGRIWAQDSADREIPPEFEVIQQSQTTKLVCVMGSQAWKHAGQVNAVALSPDGTKGVSGGQDGAVHLWDLATGKCIRTLATGSWVHGLEFFPDAKRLLIARAQGELDIIDVARGETIKTIDGASPGLRRVAIFPKGDRIVVAPYRYPISVFDVADGTALATIGANNERHQIASLALTPDGKRVLVGFSQSAALPRWRGRLDVFDVESGECLRSIESFEEYVASIAVASDGKTCLAGSGDGTVRLLDLESGKEIRVIRAHRIRVGAVGFAHGDAHAFTGSDDYTFAVFDLKDGKELWRKRGPAVHCVAMTPDGRSAFTGSIHHGVMLWNLKDGDARGKVSGHEMAVTSLAFAGDEIVTGSPDGSIRIWDSRGREVKKHVRGYGRSEFVAGGDEHTLVISERGGGIALFDIRTGDKKTLPNSENVRVLGVGRGGKSLVGILGRVLKEWNLATGAAPRDVATIPNPGNFAVIAEPSANVALVFSGNGPGSLELLDLEAHNASKTIWTTGKNGFVRPLTISADGSRAVTTSDNLLLLWNLKNALAQVYTGHTARVVAACLSPDGSRVISASEDRTVRILDTKTAKEIDRIDVGAANDAPKALALSKDGKTLAVGTSRGVALRFELQ